MSSQSTISRLVETIVDSRLLLAIMGILGVAATVYSPVIGGALIGIAAMGGGARVLMRELFPSSPPSIVRAGRAQIDLWRVAMERYGTLVDNLAASVVIRNREGSVTYCSPFTEVLTGYPLEEIYAAKEDFFVSVTHEEDREKHRKALMVSSSGEPFQFRSRLIHKSGMEIWVETRTVPVCDIDGDLLFSLSIGLDVTGQVRYQKQVEERNKDLHEFTYMVSHDLKAPIYTIKGMVGVIEEDCSDLVKAHAPLRDSIAHIHNAMTRVEGLISSVLEYSRVSTQDLALTAVDLNLVMKDVLNDFAAVAKEAKAEISVIGTLPTVIGERVRIYQVFSNLLGNALKYREPTRAPKIVVEATSIPGVRQSTITMSDNGIGIPAEKLPTIFRPFQRAHTGSVSGMGIGLACVRKIVERCGGRVEVSSDQGSGSKFFITLKTAI